MWKTMFTLLYISYLYNFFIIFMPKKMYNNFFS